MSFRPVTQEEADMTNAQAAKLQLKWKLRFPVVACAHLHQEGQKEQGALTGTSHCLTCGEEFGGPSSSTKP
jgi:hypothetical protein